MKTSPGKGSSELQSRVEHSSLHTRWFREPDSFTSRWGVTGMFFDGCMTVEVKNSHSRDRLFYRGSRPTENPSITVRYSRSTATVRAMASPV